VNSPCGLVADELSNVALRDSKGEDLLPGGQSLQNILKEYRYW
jgi:hypothetical protein